jgi:hypothetical protein
MSKDTKVRNKLNEKVVQHIRDSYKGPQRKGKISTGPTMKELGDEVGVSAAQICRILKNLCWKDTPETEAA